MQHNLTAPRGGTNHCWQAGTARLPSLSPVFLARTPPYGVQCGSRATVHSVHVIWPSRREKAAPRTIRCSTFEPRRPFDPLTRIEFFLALTTRTPNQRNRVLSLVGACAERQGSRGSRTTRRPAVSVEFGPRGASRLASGFHNGQPQSRHPASGHSHGP